MSKNAYSASMAIQKPTRLDIYPHPELVSALDRWRRDQPDLPPRAEAARRLIELGLAKSDETAERPKRRRPAA